MTVCSFQVKGISVRNLWIFANIWLSFYENCVQNQLGHKTLKSLEDPHWRSKFDSIGTISQNRIRICFSNLILWTLCGKTYGGEAESIILILALSIFLSKLSLSWKFELTTFPSHFRKFQTFFAIIFNNWGKTVIRFVFFSVSTILNN